MKKLTLIVLTLLVTFTLFAQGKVTGIFTDYNGFFASTATSNNPVQPDNSHNLLGFTYNGINYSTGVNDSTLAANGISFISQTFRAIPLTNVPSTQRSDYFVGLGQMYDGIHNGVNNSDPNQPFPGSPITAATLASFLTDGINGLNLGTGLANIPSGSVLRFNLGASGITPESIGDGIPDILFVQIASPENKGDKMKFVDINGQTVGSEITFNLSNTTQYPKLANWKADFYQINATQTSTSYINTSRPIAMLAIDLSEMGLTADNYTEVQQLVYTTAGSSDPAFVAFNEPSVSLPSRLGIISQPTVYQTGVIMNPAFQVRLLNSFNQPVMQPGVPVTVYVESGNGELAGTITQLTDEEGIAWFHDLTLNGSNTHSFRFQASSLMPAISDPIIWSTLLPMQWKSFRGSVKVNQAELIWQTSHEQLCRDYIIERSNQNNQWTAIGTLTAKRSLSINTYHFIDKSPITGVNVYRIVQRDLNGKIYHSESIRLHVQPVPGEFRIIGNPVQSGLLSLEIKQSGTIMIFNNMGRKILEKKLNPGQHTLSLNGNQPGIYYVRQGEIIRTILVQ